VLKPLHIETWFNIDFCVFNYSDKDTEYGITATFMYLQQIYILMSKCLR